jgi:hypothetical protein
VVRAQQSDPIPERIYQALTKLKTAKYHLPQSLMGQAIDYTLSQWSMLGVVWLMVKSRSPNEPVG